MSRALVLGGSGFLGRRLAASLPGFDVVATGYSNVTATTCVLDLRDVRALRHLIQRTSPSVILYAAGLTDVDECERAPELAHQLNARAPAEVGAVTDARVVYFSTDYVFDGARGHYDENDTPAPVNTYGRTKLAGERAVLGRQPGNLVVRVSGLYDDVGTKAEAFSNPRRPLTSEDTRLSSPVHVEDVASAIRLLLNSDMGGVYHVAGPDVLSRYEFWRLAALRTLPAQSASAPVVRCTAAPRPRDSSLRSQRMESLGWRARRVCAGLPQLHPRGRPDAFSAHGTQAGATEALLIDCVGGLLAGRTWLPQDGMLAEIDGACATATSSVEFWPAAARTLDLAVADLGELQERVAFRYAPNPPVWDRLSDWRARYRLALVNNGPSATFRCWVKKYGLDSVFDVLANSEEMGVRKPAGEFFLAVADRLGVAPDRCVLLDDDPGNIEGARRSGMHGVRTFESKGFPLSNYVWEGTAEGAILLEGGQHG